MTEQMIETGADVFGRPVAWATVDRTGEQSALFATRGTGVPGVMFDGIGQADPLDEHGSWCGTPCGRPNHPTPAAPSEHVANGCQWVGCRRAHPATTLVPVTADGGSQYRCSEHFPEGHEVGATLADTNQNIRARLGFPTGHHAEIAAERAR